MKLKLLYLFTLLSVSITIHAQWMELGGKDSSTFNGNIEAIVKDLNGNIYVGGYFTNALGKEYVAKWDGSKWSELGGTNSSAFNGYIFTMTIDKNGNIYAAGNFTDAQNSQYVAKWDGNKWSEIAKYSNNDIQTLTTDTACNLYAAGYFSDLSGNNYVAKLTGSTWSELGGNTQTSNLGWNITCLKSDVSGNIYACGSFKNASGSGYVAKWDGGKWVEVGGNNISKFYIINDFEIDAGGKIYASVLDTVSANVYHSYIAVWDGIKWSVVGGNNVNFSDIIKTINVDALGNVYASGAFLNSKGNTYVAKWDGSTWSELGGTNTSTFYSFLFSTIDNTGNVYACGSFTNNKSKRYVAKYRDYILKPSPTLSIDFKDTTSCSFTVNVPVRGKNLINISKLTGSIGWDTTFLNFGGVNFANKGIVLDSSKIDFTNVTNGKMAYNWSDTIGHTAADFTPVFTLTFYPKNDFSGGTGVWFDSIPTKLEIDTAIGVAATKASFNDGWVLLSDTPTVVQVGTILQCFAGCSPIHYQWYDNNGNPINGDTLNYITPTNGGTYTCTVTYVNGNRVSSLPFHVILPVTMLNFKCYRLNEIQTKLEWQTASEINTSHFNIQRSTDGKNFATIGNVNAKGASSYNYNDNNLPVAKGNLYYRLQIVDKDGAISYSEVRELSIVNCQLSIAPNPAKSFVTVTGNNIKKVILLDLTGRTVFTKEVSNTNTIKLSVNNLSKGIYLVKAILNDGSIKTDKLVVE